MKRNNYKLKPKNSTVYTPSEVSQYLYDIISCHIKPKVIFDPSIGKGSLTKPWESKSVKIIGSDINAKSKNYCDTFLRSKFEDIEDWPYRNPDLILCNPPFNAAKGRKLYPEIFLRHIVRLFGNNVPIVLFAPMGFRLNQTMRSSRWNWLKDNLEISSIISLPTDCFDGVKFHSEILIFNIPQLKPHYLVCA
jgi:type I restriction enzyme M protein